MHTTDLFIQKTYRETLAASAKERQSYFNSLSYLLNDSFFKAACVSEFGLHLLIPWTFLHVYGSM